MSVFCGNLCSGIISAAVQAASSAEKYAPDRGGCGGRWGVQWKGREYDQAEILRRRKRKHAHTDFSSSPCV